MKTPFGLKLALVIVALAVAATGAVTVRTSLALGDLASRVALSKKALDALTASVLAESERASKRGQRDDGEPASSRELDAIALKLQSLSRRLDALESGGGDVEEIGMGDAVGRPSGGSAVAPGALPGRVGLDGIARGLGMSEEQKQRATQIINDARSEVVKILDARGPDGRSMSEQIADIAKGPGGRAEKSRAIFNAMSGTDVPGRDESYVSAIMGVRDDATADFKSNLTDAQVDEISKTRINLFGIDTGYSPIAEALKKAFQGAGN